MKALKKLVTMPFPSKKMAKDYAKQFAGNTNLVTRVRDNEVKVAGVTFPVVLRVYQKNEKPKPVKKATKNAKKTAK